MAFVPLRLRPPRLEEEQTFRAIHDEMAEEGWVWCFGLQAQTDWREYLQRLDDQRHGLNLPDNWVPTTFLVADVDGDIVGRTSIRHELNDFLAREGGHIGYAVVAQHRRRGYATEILRQSLVIARSFGNDRILVTCDETNVGSIKAIERCGGVYGSTIEPAAGGTPKRRYWID